MANFHLYCGNFLKFKEIRDKSILIFERMFYFLSLLLALLAITMVIQKVQLLDNYTIINGMHGFAKIHARLTIFPIIASSITFLLSIHAICLTRKRQCHVAFTKFFGIGILCGSVPLFVEGYIILAFSNLNNETIESICMLDNIDLKA